MNRRLRNIGLAAGVATGLVGAGYYWARSRYLPKTRGSIKIQGLSAPVEVIRDRWGVPHIYAQDENDLMFAQGFIHAQDRLWQMDFQRRLVAGRLSEIVGETALPLDRWMRILGLRRAAQGDEALISGEARLLIDSYTAGVNAYISRGRLPMEFSLLNYTPEPWSVVDSLSWGKMMAWTLSANWEAEMLRAQLIALLGAERAAELEEFITDDEPYIIPPGTDYSKIGRSATKRARAAKRLTGPSSSGGLGSNNWVIAGSRTVTGKPILANDPHLFMSIPAIWYESHLVGGKLDLTGVTFLGTPGIIIGHNRYVAWGFTNGFPDVQDLYMERLTRTEQGKVQYEYKGEKIDAQVLQEPIHVKGGKVAFEEVIITRHGPIINQLAPDFSGETPLALHWTAYDPEQLFTALYHMNRAHTCTEFREALRYWGTPPQNAVYADVEGNIGYTQAGRVPIRSKADGRVPVPGWTGMYEWSDFIPFDELPHLDNPPQGYIVTANNRVADKDYPYYLGSDYVSAYRARRIQELIEARPKIDMAYMQDMQFDQLSIHARTMARLIGGLRTTDPELKIITERMKRWDGQLSPDSPETTIYEVFYRRLLLAMTSAKLGDLALRYLGKGPVPILAESSLFGEKAMEWMLRNLEGRDSSWLGSDSKKSRDTLMRIALRESVDEIKNGFGPSITEWSWKKMHKIRFAHTLGRVKPLDQLFNRGPYGVGGDSNTIWNTATSYHDLKVDQVVGPPFRFIADLGDLDHCLGMLAPGQSGHPLSKHYADQIKAWFARGYHPMIFTREELEKEAEDRLNLLPL